MSVQRSLENIPLKCQYEADDENQNVIKLMTQVSSQNCSSFTSLSQDSFNEGGSEDEALPSKGEVITDKPQVKRITSNGTPVGKSEVSAKVSGDDKKYSS